MIRLAAVDVGSNSVLMTVAEPLPAGDFRTVYESFKTTRLAAGLGVLPAGAIWQFDMALDVALSSDLDSKLINASAYVKYLF